jgi:hypothetical protein
MPPPKYIVNDIRHKERHRREIMHAPLEASIRGPEHEGCDPILNRSQRIQRGLLEPSHIIRRHQTLLQPLIRLPHLLTIILIQRPQRLNLIPQMLGQRPSEGIDQPPQFLPVVLQGGARPRVLLEGVKPRGERAVLLDVLRHEALDAGDGLDGGEEDGFFGVVVVVHRFGPAEAVGQEVADGGGRGGGEVRRLEVDGVQAADDAVVGEGHLRGDVGGGVGCLGGQLVEGWSKGEG